ncbi:hypothetical protein [Acidovorax sp. sic0104]|uniref:hypothetical protein n=1 Tax=Acidovorax sp. sic0104 TaxID=2854784 RepID=UPI001C44430C|nr:hypothetical protein [Acidovorax sp. sic0104]MBV7542027.1 hypothetical protein [Acidovorax sp. sic0104]
MSTGQRPPRHIIQDDGEFALELAPSYPAAQAPGFLTRRCPRTKVDFGVMGGFQEDEKGWCSDLAPPPGSKTPAEPELLVSGASCISAMVSLWQHRRRCLTGQAV